MITFEIEDSLEVPFNIFVFHGAFLHQVLSWFGWIWQIRAVQCANLDSLLVPTRRGSRKAGDDLGYLPCIKTSE
jgi:hypothetical protein